MLKRSTLSCNNTVPVTSQTEQEHTNFAIPVMPMRQSFWGCGPLWSKRKFLPAPSMLVTLTLSIRANFVSSFDSARENVVEYVIYLSTACSNWLFHALSLLQEGTDNMPEMDCSIRLLSWEIMNTGLPLPEWMWILTVSTETWSNRFYSVCYLGKASLTTHKHSLSHLLHLAAISLNLPRPIYLYGDN